MTEHPLGRGIPTGDDPAEVFGNDGVFGGSDDRSEPCLLVVMAFGHRLLLLRSPSGLAPDTAGYIGHRGVPQPAGVPGTRDGWINIDLGPIDPDQCPSPINWASQARRTKVNEGI